MSLAATHDSLIQWWKWWDSCLELGEIQECCWWIPCSCSAVLQCRSLGHECLCETWNTEEFVVYHRWVVLIWTVESLDNISVYSSHAGSVAIFKYVSYHLLLHYQKPVPSVKYLSHQPWVFPIILFLILFQLFQGVVARLFSVERDCLGSQAKHQTIYTIVCVKKIILTCEAHETILLNCIKYLYQWRIIHLHSCFQPYWVGFSFS